MNSPCKICIVNAMCQKICTDLFEYIREASPDKKVWFKTPKSIIGVWIRECILNKEIIEVGIRIYYFRPEKSYFHINITDGNINNMYISKTPVNHPTRKDLNYTVLNYSGYRVRVGGIELINPSSFLLNGSIYCK